MKTKPVSHKSDNTFKFESFSDRLSKINVSLLHNIRRGNILSAEETDTHFAITFEKWLDFNSTQDFRQLCRTIGSLVSVRSLPQIVHRKDQLIEILLENVNRRDNLALNAVLELLVALAKDLGADFYQHFHQVFNSIVKRLDSTDPETIENVFICLTYLLKYLSKYMIKEFGTNYKLFESLLISKKEYIKRFSSEALSFLVRKTQNKSSIIDVLFESVTKESKLVEGIGLLLFESVKGVSNGLHSCAEEMIQLLIDKYVEVDNQAFSDTIAIFFGYINENISKSNFDLIWKLLLKNCENKRKGSPKMIVLLKAVIDYKKCHLVENSSELITHLLHCMNNEYLNSSDTKDLLFCFNLLIHNRHQQLNAMDYQQISESVFVAKRLPMEQVMDFVRSLFTCVTFERSFLPSVLSFYSQYLITDSTESNENRIAALKLLTELVVTKRPRPLSGKDIASIIRYPLAFDPQVGQSLLAALRTQTDLKTMWSLLVCLPNFTGLDQNILESLIIERLNHLKTQFVSSSIVSDRWLGYIIVEAITALIIMKHKMTDKLNPHYLVDLIIANPSNTEFLRALDLYLSYSKQVSNAFFDSKMLENLYRNSLEANLSSHSKARRLLSLHILTLFDHPLPPSEDIDSPKTSIFNICFDAESVLCDFSQYRMKVKHLQSLDHSFVKRSTPLPISEGLSFELMPIHYLLGALYENFSLIWTPITKIIETYAKGMEDKKLFMNILLNHLRLTTSCVKSNFNDDSNNFEQDISRYLNSESYFNYVSNHSCTQRPDFANHRILLLKAMDLFPEVVEPSNREFITLLFEFINSELSYHTIISKNAKENIERNANSNDCELDVEFDTSDGRPESGRKILWKSLFSYLSVISKFKNPKALYRERELLEFNLNLLTSPDSESQRHAFNCISNYDKYLTEFRDNFLRLIDEKTFKTEIYSFILNSEDETTILKSEHRSRVVPLVLRILYGKLMASNGTKTHGKNKSDFRRSIILKVLSAFDQKELILFMDFVFAPISQWVECHYTQLKQRIDCDLNTKSMTPLRQLQALTRTLHFVTNHLGNNSLQITSYVLKVLVVISTLVTKILTENRREVNEQSIVRLKDIRNSCLKMCRNFFEMFDSYEFNSIEIDAIFNGLIWPLLPHLDTESLTTPSPLLTLLMSFGKNARFFKLLTKCHSSDTSLNCLNPISKIIELYANPKVQNPVIIGITELISNLLTLDDFDPIEHNLTDFEVTQTRLISRNENGFSYGTQLCLPFVSLILDRIGLNFKRRITDSKLKKKARSFTNHELTILSRLTPYVTQTDQSLNLALLLINSMEYRKIEEQKELQTMRALSHLMKNVKLYVNQMLKSLTPLFGSVSNCNSRTELCRTLRIVCEDDHHLSGLSQLICDMNAFNPKFPEEPDYVKRIDAFKSINSKLESISKSEFTCELISLILYNCIHFVHSCNDLAIRESASNTLKIILVKLDHFGDNNLFETYAINLLLYSTISKGFRNNSETVRHELIDILISMIEVFGQKHPSLQQLSLLCNKEDEEMDFWLNIKHIQLHRRSRALKRLIHSKELLSRLTHRIFSDFLIPLTNVFLADGHYKNNISLVNASIEAIGVFSGHLQWSKYYHLLKYYINQLIHQKGEQKTNIKIVCSLLDNFSFCESSVAPISEETEGKEDPQEVLMSEEEEDEDHNKMQVDSDNSVAVSAHTPNRIVDSISNNLLPLLNKVLHQKSQIDFAYDSMKSQFPEDEEIQRIPIGLAVIKLIKSIELSDHILKTSASSVILRLCQFLQSRAQSIRDSSRNTLIKVMRCLGPKYLPTALNQMKAILSKGYQRHVFVYTIHAILAEMRSQLKPGDLDNCLEILLETCSLELFGNLSEEKQVSEITSKLKEAKKSKSFEIFEIMSSLVSHNRLNQLLSPLKTTLFEAHTHKVVKKVSQSLGRVGHGLVANPTLDELTLTRFIFTTINDVIDLLKTKHNESKEETKEVKRIDSFLISRPIYQRSEKVSKIGGTTNHHILVEFGLNCLLALLKQNRLEASNEEHLTLLNPFVALLNGLLESNDPKLTTLSLQCLHILYSRFRGLPSFSIHSESVMKNIFVLLHKYAKFGYNDKDDSNVHMVLLCFKTLSFFIRDRTDVRMTDEQMAVLLSYIDQDLHNDLCQSTVFFVLKSIIAKNYNSLALHRIMKRVTQMAITSEMANIREQCSQICVKYLTDYGHPKGLKKKIDFFIRHLEYEQTSGRESALSVVKHIVASIDNEFINKNIALFFIPLSSRLVNESSSECKKTIAESIIRLLRRISESDRNKLFTEMVVPWLQSGQVIQKLLASHLCTIFLSVENKDFLKHLSTILPFIGQQLDPTRYQSSVNDEALAKNTDALIYQHLSLFLKLIKCDPQLLKQHQLSDEINAIFEHTLNVHLLHSHLWVRVISVQIFGQLFCEYPTQRLSESIDNPSESHEYLLSNCKHKLTQMISKFCLIFRDIYDAEVLSDQLIKNLVYISRVFLQSSLESDNSSTFKWLLNKLVFEVKYEIKERSQKDLKRICMFKWMAVVAVELGSDRLHRYIANFLPLLCREETNSETPTEENQLLVLTKQVLQLLKNLLGNEKFAEFYAKAKTDLSRKRIERKKKSAVQTINEVVKSTKRKISKHNRTKNSKKRKVSHYR